MILRYHTIARHGPQEKDKTLSKQNKKLLFNIRYTVQRCNSNENIISYYLYLINMFNLIKILPNNIIMYNIGKLLCISKSLIRVFFYQENFNARLFL